MSKFPFFKYSLYIFSGISSTKYIWYFSCKFFILGLIPIKVSEILFLYFPNNLIITLNKNLLYKSICVLLAA